MNIVFDSEFLLIVGMMLVTFGVRYPVLAWLSKRELPKNVVIALEFVPVAVLSAIVVPMATIRDSEWAISLDNPFFVATVFSILVALKTRNLLLTIVLGMAVFFIYRLWIL
ncbi:MAG: AzlD domain-containing protein [Pseudomonadota bacterium]